MTNRKPPRAPTTSRRRSIHIRCRTSAHPGSTSTRSTATVQPRRLRRPRHRCTSRTASISSSALRCWLQTFRRRVWWVECRLSGSAALPPVTMRGGPSFSVPVPPAALHTKANAKQRYRLSILSSRSSSLCLYSFSYEPAEAVNRTSSNAISEGVQNLRRAPVVLPPRIELGSTV